MTTSSTPSYRQGDPAQAHPGELARKLGYAGLIPFVGGALFVWLLTGRIDREPFIFLVNAITGYAALIVSFLGGLPWGLVMRDAAEPDDTVRKALWWGIAYSLLAWVALCMPAHAGLVVLGTLLIVAYLNDRKLYPALGVEHWLTLRFQLTAIASLSCFLTAAQI
ncbi:DUF3429 domain-containing protein [Aquabacterium lacunae]|uniref:DUF3429 domain-containing protein n=1 Tax=Aquabacterium lacunae TaxID=2528630 RepID=UPI001FE20A08|nr:DUF3429 domain-containing protein [Aquabacterium lacunae]